MLLLQATPLRHGTCAPISWRRFRWAHALCFNLLHPANAPGTVSWSSPSVSTPPMPNRVERARQSRDTVPGWTGRSRAQRRESMRQHARSKLVGCPVAWKKPASPPARSGGRFQFLRVTAIATWTLNYQLSQTTVSVGGDMHGYAAAGSCSVSFIASTKATYVMGQIGRAHV